jgi:hypothetical protein
MGLTSIFVTHARLSDGDATGPVLRAGRVEQVDVPGYAVARRAGGVRAWFWAVGASCVVTAGRPTSKYYRCTLPIVRRGQAIALIRPHDRSAPVRVGTKVGKQHVRTTVGFNQVG